MDGNPTSFPVKIQNLDGKGLIVDPTNEQAEVSGDSSFAEWDRRLIINHLSKSFHDLGKEIADENFLEAFIWYKSNPLTAT